jgi:N-acetylmuramoyl-L-alanine amidase
MKESTVTLSHGAVSLPLTVASKPHHYLPRTVRKVRFTLLLVLVAGACRPTTAPVPVAVDRAAPARGTLPPLPLVQGPLAPRVVYPRAEQMIASPDSTFVFGSLGNGRATLNINGQPVRVWPNGTFLGFIPNPPPTDPIYHLVAAVGADTVRVNHPVRVAGMTPPVPDSLKPPPAVITDTTPTWVLLGDTSTVVNDTDRVVIGRPGPNSVYRWFLFPGTRAQITGRYPGFARIRLDSTLQIWVDTVDARRFSADTVAPRRVAANARVRSAEDWVDFIIPIAERPAFFVEEGERSIQLTLYGTRGGTDQVNYPTQDPLVRLVEWEQVTSDRVRYTLRLSREPFGYLVLYENNSFVLRVRRPPTRTASNPLRGLRITVDPGHPPGGAVGPTGFTEPEAALPVAFMLKRILEERGATVVMTRTTNEPVDLQLRPIIARRTNSHALVSIHYNAYGDGINPFAQRNGMEVYFYRPHAEPLARAVQSMMLAYQPLEDRGIYYRSLALVRMSWMPAILAEGGFMMIPEQEHAMKTPEFQDRYARAIADGLEAFFRTVRLP